MAKRGKEPVKRTNEMDPSIPSCFLKIVFMDQTILHLMVIVSIVSQLSVSNKHHSGAPWRIGCPVILGFEPLASCKCLFHKTVRWAARLKGDKWGPGTVSSSILEVFGFRKSPKEKRAHPHELYFHVIEVISSCQRFTTGSKIW